MLLWLTVDNLLSARCLYLQILYFIPAQDCKRIPAQLWKVQRCMLRVGHWWQKAEDQHIEASKQTRGITTKTWLTTCNGSDKVTITHCRELTGKLLIVFDIIWGSFYHGTWAIRCSHTYRAMFFSIYAVLVVQNISDWVGLVNEVR